MAGIITANGKLITKAGVGGYFVINHAPAESGLEEISTPITTGTVSSDIYPIPAQRRYGLASNFSGSMVVVSSTAGAPYLERYDWSDANNRYELFGSAVDVASANPANTLAISKDGNFMAIPYSQSPTLVTYKWSSANNTFMRTNPASPLPGNHLSYGCYMVRLSPDGQFLAVASYAAVAGAGRLSTYKWNEANFRYEGTAMVDQDVPQPTYSLGMSDDHSRCVVAYQGQSPFMRFYNWNETNNRYEKLPDVDVGVPTHALSAFMSADGNTAVMSTQGDSNLGGIHTYKWNGTNNRYEKTANSFPHYNYDYTYVASNNNATDLLVVLQDTGRLAIFRWVAANNRYEEQVGLIDSPTLTNWTFMTPNPPTSRVVLSMPNTPFLKTVNFE